MKESRFSSLGCSQTEQAPSKCPVFTAGSSSRTTQEFQMKSCFVFFSSLLFTHWWHREELSSYTVKKQAQCSGNINNRGLGLNQQPSDKLIDKSCCTKVLFWHQSQMRICRESNKGPGNRKTTWVPLKACHRLCKSSNLTGRQGVEMEAGADKVLTMMVSAEHH